jgi:hypothetical protein
VAAAARATLAAAFARLTALSPRNPLRLAAAQEERVQGRIAARGVLAPAVAVLRVIGEPFPAALPFIVSATLVAAAAALVFVKMAQHARPLAASGALGRLLAGSGRSGAGGAGGAARAGAIVAVAVQEPAGAGASRQHARGDHDGRQQQLVCSHVGPPEQTRVTLPRRCPRARMSYNPYAKNSASHPRRRSNPCVDQAPQSDASPQMRQLFPSLFALTWVEPTPAEMGKLCGFVE